MQLNLPSLLSQKLVAVLATPKLITASLEALHRVLYIRYLIQFHANLFETLINAGSESIL